VPTEQENKAIFRRHVEEVGNRGKLELAGEIFDRYVSHQPDTTPLELGPRTSSGFEPRNMRLSPTCVSA
jgi:hypothetical protein